MKILSNLINISIGDVFKDLLTFGDITIFGTNRSDTSKSQANTGGGFLSWSSVSASAKDVFTPLSLTEAEHQEAIKRLTEINEPWSVAIARQLQER